MQPQCYTDIEFHSNDFVRNQHKRLLTVQALDERGMIYVNEEKAPYFPFELERVDQTNLVVLGRRY